MRITGRWMGILAAAAIVAGCGERGVTSAAGRDGGITRGTTLSGLTVSITGQSPIRPTMLCAYFAHVSGGDGNYSYSWTQSAGTGSDVGGGEYDAKSTTGFLLTVNVSDGSGKTGSAVKTVSISSNSLVCPI